MDKLNNIFNIDNSNNQLLIPIIANSNTDKDIIFNILSKNANFNSYDFLTIDNTIYKNNNNEYIFINLPSTKSLLDIPKEKLITRDFLCFASPDCVIVVGNIDSLDSSFNLLFQVMELTNNIIFCINISSLKCNLVIDKDLLEAELGIPIILNNNFNKYLTTNLLDILDTISSNKYHCNTRHFHYECNIENVISSFDYRLQQSIKNISSRWIALRIIDNDKDFFKSVSIYLDESCVTKLYSIKESFPKTSDPIRVRCNINKKIHEYSIYLKNKVCSEKTDNSNMPTNYSIKSQYILFKILTLVMILLLSFIFLTYNVSFF